MKSAPDAIYLANESMQLGAFPIVRIGFYPYYFTNGFTDNATALADSIFSECPLSPDGFCCRYVETYGKPRIQIWYVLAGFEYGYWVSAALESKVQSSSYVALTWEENPPGFDTVLSFKTALTEDGLDDVEWEVVSQGVNMILLFWYQIMWEFRGYRSWALDEDDVGDADNWTAWAIDRGTEVVIPEPPWLTAADYPDPTSFQSYAAPGHGEYAYIQDMQLKGEYGVISDVESAGTISQEIPTAFNDLVAGDYSGLTVNNRHGELVDEVWVPKPLYSPNKEDFIFNNVLNESWHGRQVKVSFGWYDSALVGFGWGITPFLQDPGFLANGYSDWLYIFYGTIVTWGPVARAVDEDGKFQPNTVQIYARDYLRECLDVKMCIPDEYGDAQPLTYGSFLVEGDEVKDWVPTDPIDTIDFAKGTTDEFYSVTETGCTIISPGMDESKEFMTLDEEPVGSWAVGDTLTDKETKRTCEILEILSPTTYIIKNRSGEFTLGGIISNGTNGAEQGAGYPTFVTFAFRCIVSGANQNAYGVIKLATPPVTNDVFIKGDLRFSSIPTPYTAITRNLTFLRIDNISGTPILYLSVNQSTYEIYCYYPGQETNKGCSSFAIYENTWFSFSLWFSPLDAGPGSGQIKLWINGSEVYSYADNDSVIAGLIPATIYVGAMTGATAEDWTVDFNDIKIYEHYYRNAYRVTGTPNPVSGDLFTEIMAVYIDNNQQPASRQIQSGEDWLTQTMTKYPEYGMVQFTTNTETESDFSVSGDVQLRVYDNPTEVMLLDVAPNGGGWIARDTLTGSHSGITCKILEVITPLIYIIKARTGEFIALENISNASGSTAQQSSTYPVFGAEIMTLDVAPGGVGWGVNDTLTGVTSGKTCKIVEALSSLTYIIKKRSGDFTLGEVIGNGTITADQGATFPTFGTYITNAELLTLDVAPATVWAIGDTLTGVTSGVTCKIIEVIGTEKKQYTIKHRTGDFTLGEVIGNGTVDADQGAAFPTIVDYVTSQESLKGMHAVDIIENLLAYAGIDTYIDSASFDATKAACPDDFIHARFDPGGIDTKGLKDYASIGMTVADAIKEVCSRVLYWVFFDFEQIKLVPYIAGRASDESAAIDLDATNQWECNQTIDVEDLNTYVGGKYGWYDRDNSKFYLTGTTGVGKQGEEVDFTWDSPVAFRSRSLVKTKLDLLLGYLGVREIIEPVRMGLKGIRLELMDVVSLDDAVLLDTAKKYWLTRKEISLDSPIIGGKMEVSLTLMDFMEA